MVRKIKINDFSYDGGRVYLSDGKDVFEVEEQNILYPTSTHGDRRWQTVAERPQNPFLFWPEREIVVIKDERIKNYKALFMSYSKKELDVKISKRRLVKVAKRINKVTQLLRGLRSKYNSLVRYNRTIALELLRTENMDRGLIGTFLSEAIQSGKVIKVRYRGYEAEGVLKQEWGAYYLKGNKPYVKPKRGIHFNLTQVKGLYNGHILVMNDVTEPYTNIGSQIRTYNKYRSFDMSRYVPPIPDTSEQWDKFSSV